MKNSFIGECFAETEDARFYHGFRQGGHVFSALQYIIFNHEGRQFFGKVHSVFFDKILEMNRVECSVFRFPDGADRGNDDYPELWAVSDETMEIPISSIEPFDVTIVHVPVTVADEQIIDYVDANIGKSEHEEGRDSDSDYDSDDDMSDFIVNGDYFGFYQYSVDQDNKLHYAPPPKFSDKYMSFESMDDDEKLTHEFITHVKTIYIVPRLVCMTDRSPFENDDEIIQLLMTHKYVTHDDSFFFMKDQQEIKVECDVARASALAAFVFLLRTMLVQAELPSVSDMYDFCLRFELTA